ncbi:MAG TPA: type II toxin-antitoxin system HicA family toxin [Vicinamibacterales bacterium]
MCRSARDEASASDRCFRNEDRSEAWISFAPCREAKFVGSFSQHGFVEVRRRESHRHARRTDADGVTVPVPDHRELAIGTLLSIIRQSGLPRAQFEE